MKIATIMIGLLAASTFAPSRALAAEAPAADEEGAAVKDEAPAKKEEKKAILGPQGAFYTGASVSASPSILLGYFPIDELTVAAGVGFRYNGNGTAASPLTDVKGTANDKVGSDLVLAVAYFVHDKHPFAMGPELVVTGSVAPADPMHVVVVEPLWALRYAPWSAPIAIGTDVGMAVTMVGGGTKPTVGLTTTGLDILFAF